MIIPSIDLMNGKLVQLQQGKNKVIEIDNPLEIAKKYAIYTKIQLIDLDSALDMGNNFELIREICNICKCRVGGGIRTIEKAKELINAGAEKIIIGTRANPEFLSSLCKEIGKERVIVALDARDKKLSVKGWTESTEKNIFDAAKELEGYCSEFLYTCIEKEGLMNGVDFETVTKLKKITNNKISFAGGVSNLQEIKEFDKQGVDCIVGMAIYSGKINPFEGFITSLDFSKGNGIIPTIVKDKQGNVLMLAYSSKESLLKALEMRKGVYFSRSRDKLWIKGETSGNTQELLEVKTDCDKDALLFIVEQKGKDGACCLKRYSCFEEERKFDLEELYQRLQERIKTRDKNSYTLKLAKNPKLLYKKIKEEALELTKTKNKKQVIWEVADLLYFVTVMLVKRGVEFEQVFQKLKERNKKAKTLTKSPKEEEKKQNNTTKWQLKQ